MKHPDWKEAYPFASRELRLDGLKYHYLDEGVGEPLLLVHGNPTWSFYWRHLIVGLRDKFRLIAPDHIGCGLSDKPQGYVYRLSQHVENLSRLVQELDLRDVTLIAHDWGGAIGLGAALRDISRFKGFVLLNTAAFRSTAIPARIRVCRTPGLGALAVRGANAFAKAALTMAVARGRRLSTSDREGLLAPYDSWQNRIAIHRFVQDIPLKSSHPSYDELTRIEGGLSEIAQKPVMLLWGTQDWCFTEAFLDRFIEYFPEAEVHRFSDVGHYIALEAPERIVPLVRQFLEKTRISVKADNA